MTQSTPPCIKNISALDVRELRYEESAERFGERRSISRPMGLERVGVHHDLLRPGERTSQPHAESLDEEMIYVLSGTPDAWINGQLHPLGPGDCVVFVPGTGLLHCIINNSAEDVALLCVGDSASGNQWAHPLNPERRAHTPEGCWWEDPPAHPMGTHDGLPTRQVSGT